MNSTIPELKMLLASVESHLDALSQSVEAGIGQMLSASTLKRLWGYVTSKPVPCGAVCSYLIFVRGNIHLYDVVTPLPVLVFPR